MAMIAMTTSISIIVTPRRARGAVFRGFSGISPSLATVLEDAPERSNVPYQAVGWQQPAGSSQRSAANEQALAQESAERRLKRKQPATFIHRKSLTNPLSLTADC